MKYSVNNNFRSTEIAELGLNVLSGKTPVVRDAKGREFLPMWYKDIGFIVEPNIYQHIDFLSEMPFTVTFDMEEPVSFEKALVGGMLDGGQYALEEYELFAAETEAALYSEKNKIAHYVKADFGEEKTTNITLFEFKENQTARFFGVRVPKACKGDAIARIGKIAVFSREYEKQRTCFDRFGSNIVKEIKTEYRDATGKSGCIWPDYGLLSYINDGIALDDNRSAGITFNTQFDIVYRFGKILPVNKIVIAAKGELPQVELLGSSDIRNLFESKIPYTLQKEQIGDYTLYIYEIAETDLCCAAVRFLKPEAPMKAELSEVGIFTDATFVNISDEVLNEDFVGNGENLVPFMLQPGNVKAGYTEELYAVDKNRYRKIKPGLIRFWMQVDWFEKEKGVYDFDSVEMQAVWRYFELLKEIGTEVQLTHSWKVGEAARSWFSFPFEKPEDVRNSAPADPEHYAESYSKLVKEIWRRGFTNVFHISFANEPGYHWDFIAPGDRKAYYCKVVKAVDEQFRKDGIRDKTVFWCCESAESMEWIAYCRENIPECVDYYTLHCYECTQDRFYDEIMKEVNEIGAKPFLITECSEGSAIQKNPWNRSMTGLIIDSANMGGSGCVMWTIHGIKSMSVYSPDSWTMGLEGTHLWRDMISGGMPGYNYYNFGMYTRYLPNHTKVLKTEVIGEGMRAATFLAKDGNITILIECKKADADRKITVKLPDGKHTFYKHSYVPAKLECTHNAILPPVAATIEADGTFTDTDIPTDYSVLLYTTIAPLTQVAVYPERVTLAEGESVSFSAEVIDCEGGVTYSVMDGKGTITADGVYTASGVKSGDTVAVIATSQKDPSGEGIALIKIK